MSEYQYYEFRALDRPLDRRQMAELRAISTRAEITPTRFSNFYTFGNFKGDPEDMMRRYFDAFVYVANWGSHRLMFRVPKTLLGAETGTAYCNGETLMMAQIRDHMIIEFCLHEEEPFDEWSEGDEWIEELLPLREEFIRGDYRALYLGWLAVVRRVSDGIEFHSTSGEDIDPEELMDCLIDPGSIEPPVPPGLTELSPALEALVDFLKIDRDLIEAAASRSHRLEPHPVALPPHSEWLAGLPNSDKDAYLLRLLEGESGHSLRAELQKRHRDETAPPCDPHALTDDRRTLGELIEAGIKLAIDRHARESRQAAIESARRIRAETEARVRYLDQLIQRGEAAWSEVEDLIGQKRAGPYDQAVELLADQLEAADRAGHREKAEDRLVALRERHSNKPALIKRLDARGLGL